MNDDQIKKLLDSQDNGAAAREERAARRAEDERAAFDAKITRLADLDLVTYERQREPAADELGLRVSVLDQLVRERRGDGSRPAQGRPLELPTPEPWPEPVDGAALFDEIVGVFDKHMILPLHAATALALWVIFAHALDCFRVAPRLAVLSPTMRCGKTTLLSIIKRLVPRPLLASNISPAAVYRVIETSGPTLLIDEADSFARDNEPLRGILNSGHTREAAFVVRCEGESNEPRQFSTWAATVVAAIGRLPGTWIDRSIVIGLKRKTANERVSKLTDRALYEIDQLARKAARFAADAESAIRAAPAPLDALDDRANDNWQPLFAIADAAGPLWSKRSREAAVSLSVARDESQGLGVELLRDIRSIFDNLQIDGIGSAKLVEKLNGLETRPWSELRKGRGVSARGVATMLKDFEIRPRNAHANNGYHLADFKDAFERYFPSNDADSPSLSSEVPQTQRAVSRNELLQVPQPSSVRNLTECGKPNAENDLRNIGSWNPAIAAREEF